MSDESTVYVKQLLAGRDHARIHPMAGQMMNFAYLIGCSETKECLVVDVSWDPRGVVDIARAEGYDVVGGVATHAHPDHVGGMMMGMEIPGFKELGGIIDGPMHVHADDASVFQAFTGLAEDRIVSHAEGDELEVGEVSIELLHTPGHTPGGMCLFAEGHVITGDILFVGACGRTDLPGADPRKMYESLMRLRDLPEGTRVWPGHHYGHAMTSTIADERRTNPMLRFARVEDWLRLMG